MVNYQYFENVYNLKFNNKEMVKIKYVYIVKIKEIWKYVLDIKRVFVVRQ